MIWWDLRPSARFPTLETRVMDVATNVNHGISLVALNVCLLRMLYRARQKNQRWRVYSNMLVRENRWRAMRYGFDEGLIDLARGEVVRYTELLDELIEFVMEDAIALDCVTEIENLRNITRDGTSAHQQVEIYQASLQQHGDVDRAAKEVVDWLIAETVRDL